MKKIDLNGVWLYQIGDNENNDVNRLSEEWYEMPVPSNWYLRGLENHAGVVWFKRNFILEGNQEENQIWLSFEGVDYYTEIWINGNFVGSHEGYFQPFRFNITNLITKGDNILLVKVDSPFEEPIKAWPDKKRLIKGVLNHHDCRPGAWHPTFGQSGNTGGIWGNVELIIADHISLTQIKATTISVEKNTANVKLDLDIQNTTAEPVQANLTIIALYDGEEQVKACDSVLLNEVNNYFVFSLLIDNPHLWWTWDYGDPNLYQIKVIIEWGNKKIESETIFGIRIIDVDENGQLLLNGQPIFIRGTNIIPAQWFSIYRKKEIEKDILLIRNANINAVRIHAHVTCPEFYSACDEAGFLIWQDFPLQWGYIQTGEFINSAKCQIQEMIDYLYNHPSIYCWCCHNEPPKGSDSFDELLAEIVREKDTSRITHKNSTFREHPYYGWYGGCLEQFIALPGGPIPSEFGAQALPVIESLKEMIPAKALWPPDWEIWAFHNFQYDQTFNVVHLNKGDNLESFMNHSQMYQSRYLKYAIETYRRAKNKSVFGMYQFMFVDCWPAITWSVVDYYRRLKPGYDALKTAYQPVLISFDIQRSEIVRGLNIFAGVYIINDLNIGYNKARVEIYLVDSSGKEIIREEFMVNIQPNSLQCLLETDYLTTQWRVPLDTEQGEIQVRGEVYSSDGILLSQNYENLKIVETFARDFAH